MYALIASLDHLLLATRSVLQSFADDGVVYLELRTTPRALGNVAADGVIRAILTVIQDWNASHPEKMWAGLILSIDRARHDLQFAEDVLGMALKMRDEGLPVVGLDLAGDPSKGDVRIFRPIFQRAKMLGLKVTVHFAELPDREVEMDEIMSWCPDRLGHALHVPDRLKQEIIDKGIGLEMCLTCNVLAGMLLVRQRVDDDNALNHSESTREGEKYSEHHFGEWWRTNVPLSLNTDDVGIFHSTNSNEHHLAAKHFGLTKADLLDLCLRALEGAFGPAEVVERARGKVEAFRLNQDCSIRFWE